MKAIKTGGVPAYTPWCIDTDNGFAPAYTPIFYNPWL